MKAGEEKEGLHQSANSSPTLRDIVTSNLFCTICQRVRFDSGEVIRRKGLHYSEMYLITGGQVEVDLETGDGASKMMLSDPGSPIGEIAFLRGCAATATVTALAATEALLISDETLSRLERDAPALTVEFLRHLAETAEERTSYNLTLFPRPIPSGHSSPLEIYLCRDKNMLENAKRLRYQVYCQELQRNSPYADHENKTISDDLDRFGHTFVAVEAAEIIGTLRTNFASQGPLGILTELYGMTTSPYHPEATCICTKFIVKRSRRGSAAASRLISALVRFGVQHSMKECFIDCVPTLLHYYKALGFTVAGKTFFHRENGPSVPMRLDVARHGATLSQENGARDDFKLYVKTHAIKLIERVRS
jgi:predicted GNAT family N-acyltransferase